MSAKVHPAPEPTPPKSMVPTPPPPTPGKYSNMFATNVSAIGKGAWDAVSRSRAKVGMTPPEPESTLDPNSYSVANATNPENKALPLPWPSPKQGGRKSRKRRISRKRRVSRKFKKTRRPKRRKQ